MSSCPACGAEPGRAGIGVGDLSFHRCRRCRSLWLAEPPERERIASLYDGPDYFRNPGFGPDSYHGYRDYESDRDNILEKFDATLARVESLIGRGRVLDVGCGPGLMLAAAERRGWSAQGLDLNPWAVERAREAGFDAYEGTLPGADPGAFPERGFDLVTMMDLLEHVEDPGSLVAEAQRLLRPGGVLVVLTPDAGSMPSRLLGRRWPEARRAPEHLTLLSRRGLGELLARSGFEPLGAHSVGKRSSVATLAADVSPIAPRLLGPVARRLAVARVGELSFDLDPRTKFCAYARALPDDRSRRDGAVLGTLPRRPPPATPPEAVIADLRLLAGARRLREWLFARLVGEGAPGAVAEIGAGIGTFTRMLADAGAAKVLALEPDAACRAELERSLGTHGTVEIVADQVPGSTALAGVAGRLDLVLCQNVLEHVGDDAGAVKEMAASLRPGGTLALLVPAHPRLYGSLDLAYGHLRRYRPGDLAALLEGSGLEVEELGYLNLLGVPGWWLSGRLGRAGIGPGSLRAYEALLRAWRPLEDRLRPPAGLSLLARARRPV